jgi:hypothetical protein
MASKRIVACKLVGQGRKIGGAVEFGFDESDEFSECGNAGVEVGAGKEWGLGANKRVAAIEGFVIHDFGGKVGRTGKIGEVGEFWERG